MRHWLLILIGIALLGGTFWRLWPRHPYDITKVETKQYRNEACGLEMKIPMDWEVLSWQTSKKLLDEIDDEGLSPEQERKRVEFFSALLELGVDFIICDYDESNPDSITIQAVSIPGEELLNTSDDELRVNVQRLYKGELGFDTKIYDLKRMTLAGNPCIYIDLSHTPDTRINNYMVVLKDQCVAIALNAKTETFFARREQFESILSTLRFDKK